MFLCSINPYRLKLEEKSRFPFLRDRDLDSDVQKVICISFLWSLPYVHYLVF